MSTSRTAPLVFSFFFIAAFLWHPSANILRFSRHPPDLLRTFKIICFVYLTPSSRGTFQRTYFHCFPGTSVFLFPCGLIFSTAAGIIRTFRRPLSSFRLFFSHPLCSTTPSTRIFSTSVLPHPRVPFPLPSDVLLSVSYASNLPLFLVHPRLIFSLPRSLIRQ